METVAYLVHLLRSGRRHMVPLLPGQWTGCNADYSHCCCGLLALEMQNYQQQCHQNSLSLPHTAKKPEPLNKILTKTSIPGHVRNHGNLWQLQSLINRANLKPSRGSLRNHDNDGKENVKKTFPKRTIKQCFFAIIIYTNYLYIPQFPQQILPQ